MYTLAGVVKETQANETLKVETLHHDRANQG